MTDDVDDEFRTIVAEQLADLDDVDIDESPAVAPRPPAPSPRPGADVFEVTTPRSWAPPPEDDTFVPPPPLPPARTPSTMIWLGLLVVVAGVVLLGGVILGQIPGSWGTAAGFISICAGVLLLFSQLPKHRRPDPENGARL